MASNTNLIAVKNRGWLNGFGNLLRKENRQWWRSGQWLVQILIWMAIVNGILAAAVLLNPNAQAAAQEEVQTRQQATGEPVSNPTSQTALTIFFIFSGMAPAIGVVIIGQEAIISERQSGTAAWLFSKPVSRSAFLLSKFSADALGILVTMVLAQGLVASWIYRKAVGQPLPLLGFLGGLGLFYLSLLFYLGLTLMLGTLCRSRGPVIGIPMVVIFGNQLVGLAPWLGKIMPWNLLLDLPGAPSLAVALASGQPLPTISPIIGTTILTIGFIAVALWRFEREEF